jgi:hypothetical protein
MRYQKSVQEPAGCENKQFQKPENCFSDPREKPSDVHTKTSSCVEVPAKYSTMHQNSIINIVLR